MACLEGRLIFTNIFPEPDFSKKCWCSTTWRHSKRSTKNVCSKMFQCFLFFSWNWIGRNIFSFQFHEKKSSCCNFFHISPLVANSSGISADAVSGLLNWGCWGMAMLPCCWACFCNKMSECLRTYGPQIIRVPQLQIEDWAWLVVPSYKLQN